MTYVFARIDLHRTDYQPTVPYQFLAPTPENIRSCQDIYRVYCMHKRFDSVMPLLDGRLLDPQTDVLGYYHDQNLVAFSLIRRFDCHNALCDQFAWTYHQPSLRLGIETMKTECAVYRDRGYRYLYLEQAHNYKSEIAGFEILGPMT